MKEYIKTITVNDHHIDTNNHVNNITYFQWMQDVAIEHSAQAYDLYQFLDKYNGMWVVRSHEIEYLRAALLGDQIQIRSWIDKVERIRSWRLYEFSDITTGKLVVRAKTQWIYLDKDTLKPKTIPEEMKKAYGL